MKELLTSLLVLALPLFAYAETPPTAQDITKALAGLASQDGRTNYMAQEEVREWSYEGTAWEQRGSEVVAALYGEVKAEVALDNFPNTNAGVRDRESLVARKLDTLKTLRHLHNQKIPTKFSDKEFHDLFVFYLTRGPAPYGVVLLEVFDVYNLPSEELDRLLVADITAKERGNGALSVRIDEQLRAARVYLERRKSVQGVRWNAEVADVLAGIYVREPVERTEAKEMLLTIVADLSPTDYEPSREVDHALLLIGRELNVLPTPSQVCRLVTEASAKALPPTEVVE